MPVLILAAHPASGEDPGTVQERLGHPASARLLIIHADDLGMTHSINRASFEALERGWITSASIMVPAPWFPEVQRFATENPDADLGIHMTLNSEWMDYRWGPVAPRDQVPSLLDDEGYFHLVEEPVVAGGDREQIELELTSQIDRALAGGVRISHLDSHMAVLFRSEPLLELYRRLGERYDVPLLLERMGSRGGMQSGVAEPLPEALIDRVLSIGPGVPIADWPAAYEDMLSPLAPGVYQLIVHLAYADDEMRAATRDHPDWGAAWRQADLDLVRSARFREFLDSQGFILIGWRDLAGACEKGNEK